MNIALIAISFLSGMLTVFSPCALPILPLVLKSATTGTATLDTITGDDDGKWSMFFHKILLKYKRSFVIVTSLAGSVFVFTVLLKTTLIFVGLPDAFWPVLSGLLITLLGVASAFPKLWTAVSVKLRLSTWSSGQLDRNARKQSTVGELLTGLALGPVFTSCSPTYAFILGIVLIEKRVVPGTVYLAVYIIGLATVLIMISIFGATIVGKFGKIADENGVTRRLFGVLFIIIGIAIMFGWDKSLEAYLISNGGTGFGGFENHLLKYVR